jgi:hypothetical protein
VAKNVVIGTAPDSWGIWFPDDPKQTPADWFPGEVVEAGYEPPSSVPDRAEVLGAAGQQPRDLFAIVEQDMYALLDLDAPLPIARRTYPCPSSRLRRQRVRS